MYRLISMTSSRAHERVLRFFVARRRRVAVTLAAQAVVSWAVTKAATWECSTTVPTRSARPNALRRTARSRHWVVGWRCAPRPGADRRGSGITVAGGPGSLTTIRMSWVAAAFCRHPTHVRTGWVRTGRRAGLRSTTVVQSNRFRPLMIPPTPERRRSGCRCAIPSAGQPGVRFALPCRSQATAGSPGPRRVSAWSPSRPPRRC